MPSRYERPGAEPPWAKRPGERRFGSRPYWRGSYARGSERPEERPAPAEEEGDPFEIFRPGGPRKPAPRPERREESRRETPRKAPSWFEAIVPEEEREATERPEVTPIGPRSSRYRGWRDMPRRSRRGDVDLARFFPDLESVWKRVQRLKEDPRWQSSPQAGVTEISPPTEDEWTHAQNIAEFLGIPRSEFDRYSREDVWPRLLGPILEDLAAAINAERPRALPGEFMFGFGPNKAFGLVYYER